METTDDNDFAELKKQCRACAGDDDDYFLDLLTEKVVDQIATFYIDKPSVIDQHPKEKSSSSSCSTTECVNLQEFIKDITIPKKKRGSNAQHKTKKPEEEEETKIVAPSARNFDAQLARFGIYIPRKDVYDPDNDHVPVDRMNKGKKPDEEETTTVSPSEHNLKVQFFQFGIINSRTDVLYPDSDYVPAPYGMNNAKKSIDEKRMRKDKGKRKLESDDEDNEQRNVKKKRSTRGKVDLAKLGLEPPPGLSQELKDFIEQRGGKDVKLVVMKKLYKTDLEKRQDRLSIPVSQVRDNTFLTETEAQWLAGEKNHIEVNLVMPVGLQVMPGMKLRYWDTNNQYALTSTWMSVVARNRNVLTVNSIVQVWSFRDVNDKLWLILVKVRDAPVDDDVTVNGSDGKSDDNDDMKDNGGNGASARKSSEFLGSGSDHGSIIMRVN